MKILSISMREETYRDLKQRAGSQSISKFASHLIAEELAREKQELITAYKDAAHDSDLKAEDKIWDETTDDGLENE
jgi:hypothetical protein